MATPNSEQKLAIEHDGGVLLKAGAGSGKTFVLKEHMIYLAKNWIHEFKQMNNDLSEFEINIKNKFRKIVLMTFTKKAAGELKIRLHSEFKSMITKDLDNADYWGVVCESLSFLNVSTIHGFCFRLIKMGFFPNISSEQTILTESEYRDCIYNIFDNYLNFTSDAETNEFINLLLKDKNNVFESIKGIFSDPTLRLAWKNLDVTKARADIDEIIIDIVKDKGLETLFSTTADFSGLDEYKGKKMV